MISEFKKPEEQFEEHWRDLVKAMPELANFKTQFDGTFQLGWEAALQAANERLADAAKGLKKSNEALETAYKRMKSTTERNKELMKALGECTRSKANLQQALHAELRKNERR